MTAQETNFRLCLNCKADISHKRRDAIYCSRECKDAPHFCGTYCLQCGKELVIHRCNRNITKYCSGECRFLSKNPTFNASYFSEPNLENSYWAGFIAADGCILDKQRGQLTLSIGLKSTDREHLIKLQSVIGAGGIYEHDHYDKRVNKIRRRVDYLLPSDVICKDLMDNFNIYPRKSLTHEPPDLEGSLAHAFIAGYIDGDGYYGGGNNRPNFYIVGTADFLSWIAAVYSINRTPGMKVGTCWIGFYGNDAIRIRKSFQDLNLPLLDRKKNRWEELGLNLSLL